MQLSGIGLEMATRADAITVAAKVVRAPGGLGKSVPPKLPAYLQPSLKQIIGVF